MPLTPEQTIVGNYVYIEDDILPAGTIAEITRISEETYFTYDNDRTPINYLTTRLTFLPIDVAAAGIFEGQRWSVYTHEVSFYGTVYTEPHRPRYKPTREYLIADRSSNSPQAVLDNPPPPSECARSEAEVEADSEEYVEDFVGDDVESSSDAFLDNEF